MNLDFLYNNEPVGYFIEIDSFPTIPGKYKYMPYRSPGHFQMYEECSKSGKVNCSFSDSGFDKTITVRISDNYGEIHIDKIDTEP